MNTPKLHAMHDLQVALYARVSSEQQAAAKTLASQLAELQARISADGIQRRWHRLGQCPLVHG